jgi:hypothetical protein
MSSLICLKLCTINIYIFVNWIIRKIGSSAANTSLLWLEIITISSHNFSQLSKVCGNFQCSLYISYKTNKFSKKNSQSIHIFMPVSSQDLDFQHHMSWSFLCSVSSAKMRNDCSLCWYYWWNSWPSLFKLSFKNIWIW